MSEILLPATQPITPANASGIQLLMTMEIPDYNRGQVSQCNPAFSPDGRLVLAACGNNRVPVWDVQSGTLIYSLYDEPVQVVACTFSPDGKNIACGGFDRTITIWDALTGRIKDTFTGFTAPVWDIAFDPAGNVPLSASLGLLGGGSARGDIRLWDPATGQLRWLHSGNRDYLSVAFHPLGETLAYGAIGGAVGILDARTGELLNELTDSSANIGGIAYSSSGRWLAAGSDDTQVYLWQTSDNSLSARLQGHAGYVNGVAFNPGETLLISGSHDRTIGIWDMTDHTLITKLEGHTAQVLRVAFNPDGTLIASISWDGTLRLWGVPTE